MNNIFLVYEQSKIQKITVCRGDMFPCTAGIDLFPCCVDIHGIVSTNVETVVLMSRAWDETSAVLSVQQKSKKNKEE